MPEIVDGQRLASGGEGFWTACSGKIGQNSGKKVVSLTAKDMLKDNEGGLYSGRGGRIAFAPKTIRHESMKKWSGNI